MPKYYVESGHIKTTIQGRNPLHACIRALDLEANRQFPENSIEFEDTFFVSEKGFLSDREFCQITIPEETVLDTDYVIEHYNNRGR